MQDRISSRENEQVKYACHIAGSAAFRQQEGLFFAEGKRLCADLAARLKPKTLFITDKLAKELPKLVRKAETTYFINEPVADKLSETKNHQGVFCLFKKPEAALTDLDLDAGVLLCEKIQDPGNAGTLLRSAAAFGFGGVVFSPGCADPFSSKALRASMGAVARLPVIQGESLETAAAYLKEKQVTLWAAALQGAKPIRECSPKPPFALLVGNEGAGLSKEALALADTKVYIPMENGVESLNAAVAASVFMAWMNPLASR